VSLVEQELPTLPEHLKLRGTLGSVVSFLAATLYQGNPDRNHKLWNIVSTARYILHMQFGENKKSSDILYRIK
jgi:hypothetical protein